MQRNVTVEANQPLARGFAQASVRVANERAVLTLIALTPGLSNADLARQSGLGAQTTSRIVADLEAREVISRGAVLRGRRGQPATPLFINPDGAYVIGVDVSWRSLEVVLQSMTGQTLASISRSHAYPDAETIFGQIAAEVATLRAGMTQQQSDRLIGLGVACPCHIDEGIAALGAPLRQVELWRDIDIVARLSSITGLEVQSLNEGNAACWSQLLASPRPWPSAFACLHVSSYLVAGIVTRGTLWEGRSGNAANLGAIIVEGPDGRPATLQDVASLLALQRRLEAVGLTLPPGNALNWDWSLLQPVADAWLDDAARALAAAVLNTSSIIDLDLTVIDGVLPRPVVAELVERVNHHLALLPCTGPLPKVSAGVLGGAAAASGVAQTVLFRRFFSRAWNLFTT